MTLTLGLYDVTVPLLVRGLHNLSHILSMGSDFAEKQGIDPSELIEARLYPDMGALPAQIQRASDSAKGTVVRLGGVENTVFDDVETSFEELQERIAKTIAFIGAVPRSAIDGKDDISVELKTPRGSLNFTGRDFALGFVIPNFFFHVTTAYAILRHKGVPVGKLDYLGSA